MRRRERVMGRDGGRKREGNEYRKREREREKERGREREMETEG